VFETFPELKGCRSPSCTTIKYWAAQVGYYKLKCPKTIAADWMVIIDASIQMGEKKCVVILGIREDSFHRLKNRVLTLKDLEILSIHIVSKLDNHVIFEMLNETASVVGKISAICSDRGSEIICGVKRFQQVNPDTRHIGDTAHRVSNLLEAALEKSSRWKKFRELVTQARRKMQNSLIPGALPPSPRTKARYMNMDTLIKWAADMLVLLDQGVSHPGLNIDALRKYLSWLLPYRDDIDHWNHLVIIGQAARHVVRTEGIHAYIVDAFEQAISFVNMGPRELYFADQLTEFLLTQSRGVKFGESFIGSSEILESLFGKIKYIEREQKAFGFTSLLLAAMAAIGPLNKKIVAEAMASVKRSDIDAWAAKEIGQSIQSQRRQIKKIVSNAIEGISSSNLKDSQNKIKQKNKDAEVGSESLQKIKLMPTNKIEKTFNIISMAQEVSGIYERKTA
jgi:hypothetical protein